MKIEDISRMQSPGGQACISVPEQVVVCLEPQDNELPSDTGLHEYLPMPTPPPVWPRVFPGL